MATASSHCLHCQVPLVPNTGFCGTCGTPAGQRGAMRGPPPFPPMPAAFSGGASQTIAVALPAGDAPRSLAHALQSAGATVTGTSAQAVAFTTARRGKRSLGISVRYRGIAEIAPAGGQTTVTLRVKPEVASVAIVAIISTGLLLALTLLGNGGQLSPDSPGDLPATYNASKSLSALLFFGALGVGIPYWLLNRGSSRVLAALAPSVAAITATGPAPAAATGRAPPAPMEGIFAQLRELGTLRDQGVLSPAEHDQARAALLAKIA